MMIPEASAASLLAAAGTAAADHSYMIQVRGEVGREGAVDTCHVFWKRIKGKKRRGVEDIDVGWRGRRVCALMI